MTRSRTSLAAKALVAWLPLTRRKRTYAEVAGCTVILPIYPLAPNHHVPETIEFVRRAYDKFAAGTRPRRRPCCSHRGWIAP